MSRSYKKTPVTGMCSTTHGQKEYRTYENSAKRKKVKQLLQQEQYDVLPHEKEYGNEWSSPRDGKGWFGNLKKETWKHAKHEKTALTYYKELMRK